MNNITLLQAFDLFIYDRSTYCENKTIINYKNTIRYFIEFLEESKGINRAALLINDITVHDIKSYIVMLRDRKKLSTHILKPTVDGPVTNRTIRTYLIDIRTFFNYLCKEELINSNIMDSIKIIKSEKKLLKPLLQTEVFQIDSLFNLKCESGIRNFCIVHLMLDCGLRSGDVLKLKVDDINFNDNIIYIDDGKGKKDRLVILPGKLKINLYKYITIYRSVLSFSSGSVNFVFISVNGKLDPVTDNTIKSLFSRIRSKTGIVRLKPHLLRHTFATSFIIGGGNMEMLRLFLGHSSYSVTQDYLHVANFCQNAGVKIYKLDDVYFKNYSGYGY